MPSDDELRAGIFGGDTGDKAAPEDNKPDPAAPEKDPDTPDGGGDGGTGGGGGEGGDGKNPEQQPEKLFAGKYKTVEELESAYKEAEKGFHGDRQERAELKRQLDELKEALAPKKPEQDPKEYRQKLVERLYEEPDTVINELANQIADKKMQQALGPVMPIIQQVITNNQVQQFMDAVPDAKQYATDMAAIVKANPDLMKRKDWIEKAYLQAKVARLEEKLSGKATGDNPKDNDPKDNDPQKAADTKRAAAMPKGGKGDPPPQETDDDKMRKSIFGSPGGGKRKMFDF